MPELVLPTAEVHASFLDTITEYRQDPSFRRDRGHFLRRAIAAHDLTGQTGFAEYVQATLAEREDRSARSNGWVPQTVLWFVEGDHFIGRLSIRHRLNPWLEAYGGHIGYEVRPTERRKGHATEMLRRSLPRAHALGIDPALLTCDHDNVASRRVIETNGGHYEDRRGVKLRFWVPTS